MQSWVLTQTMLFFATGCWIREHVSLFASYARSLHESMSTLRQARLPQNTVFAPEQVPLMRNKLAVLFLSMPEYLNSIPAVWEQSCFVMTAQQLFLCCLTAKTVFLLYLDDIEGVNKERGSQARRAGATGCHVIAAVQLCNFSPAPVRS